MGAAIERYALERFFKELPALFLTGKSIRKHIATMSRHGQALDRGKTGMVFQNFNLFPHMTILENLTFAPIFVRKVPKAEARRIAINKSVDKAGQLEY